MHTIHSQKIPLDAAQKDKLREFFSGPLYLSVRSVIVAQCIEQQVAFMNMSLYANENAEAQAGHARGRAIGFNLLLDILDELSGKEDQWFRMGLEQL